MKEYDSIIFTDLLVDAALLWKAVGAYKIAHVLREHGYSVLVIDHFHFFNQEEISKIIDQAVSERTKFVGFSITFFANTENADVRDPRTKQDFLSPDFNRSFCPQGAELEESLVSRVRLRNPKCKIVVGGAIPIYETISNKNIDFLVASYAENSSVNLMKFLEGKEDLRFAYQNLHGITIIDDRDSVQYDMQKSSMKWLPEDIGVSRSLALEVSRGCIFNCSFCTFPLRGKKNNDYIRNIDLIVEELEYNYQNYGITVYTLVDDTFNDNDSKLDMMLEVKKRISFDPIFWCYARIELLMGKYAYRLDKMYDIGVRSMYLGIESLNRTAGMAVGKGMHAEKQIKVIQDIRKKYNNDILMHGSFIAGLPGEPIDSCHSTLNLILSGEFPLHCFSYTPLIIRPNNDRWQSKIDKDYARYGYTKRKNDFPILKNILKTDSVAINWQNDQMTAQEAAEFCLYSQELQWKSDRMHLASWQSWALMNYEEYPFDRVKNLLHKDVNWFELSKTKLKKMYGYKQDLFKLLNIT